MFKSLRHALADRALEFAQVIAAGKAVPVSEALASEILPVLDAIRFIERNLKRVLKPRHHGKRGRPFWLMNVELSIYREPLGVVLVIGPGNYPFFLPAVHALQALAVGNAVVIKPAPNGSRVIEMLCALCESIGVPRNAISSIDSSPRAATGAVPHVNHVVFTGSRRTGLQVQQLAADSGVPTTMELSGHDAVFVLPLADLELVGRAMRFGLSFNRSQTCIAPRRLFAQRATMEKLLPILEKQCGMLASQEISSPSAQRVRKLVEDALARGAALLCGSLDTMTPIVLRDVPRDAQILREEVFGPVLALVSTESIDEMFELSSECGMALGATVFDELDPEGVAQNLNAGCVVINDAVVPTADPRLPFAARGESGFGVTRGLEGMLAMTQIKAISMRTGRNSFRPHFDEATEDDASMFVSYITAAHSRSVLRRIRSAAECLRIGARRRRP